MLAVRLSTVGRTTEVEPKLTEDTCKSPPKPRQGQAVKHMLAARMSTVGRTAEVEQSKLP